MKSRFKLALTAMLGVLATALIVSHLLTDLVTADAKKEKLALALEIRRATRAALESRLQELSRELATGIQGGKITAPFLGWALLGEPDATGSYAVESFKMQNTAWTTSWFRGLLPGLPLARVHALATSWARISTGDGQVYFLLMTPLRVKSESGERERIAAGVLPVSVFSELGLIAKGGVTELYVVDAQGFSYSHPDQQFAGSKLSAHPIVAALGAAPQGEDSGAYGSGAGRIVGGYEQAEESNLYVVAATPYATRSATAMHFLFETGFVTLAIMLLSALVIYFLNSAQARRLGVLEKNIELLQAGGKGAAGGALEPESLKEFARGIVSYLRATVGEALATQTGEPFRKMREFLEGLAAASGAPPAADEAVEINPLVSQVVSIYRREMIQAGIVFEEQLKSDLSVRGGFDDFKQSLKVIFQFVIRHIEKGGGKKKIVLNVDKTGGLARLTLEGSGHELKTKMRRKLFQPFSVGLPGSRILGMDLALAKNQIEAMNGTLEVESVGADGLKITLQLPDLAPATASATSVAPQIAPELAAKSVPPEKASRLPPAPGDDSDLQVQQSKARSES